MVAILQFAAGVIVVAATIGLFWIARATGSEPVPFMNRRGMQVLVPMTILVGACGGGTLIIQSIIG